MRVSGSHAMHGARGRADRFTACGRKRAGLQAGCRRGARGASGTFPQLSGRRRQTGSGRRQVMFGRRRSQLGGRWGRRPSQPAEAGRCALQRGGQSSIRLGLNFAGASCVGRRDPAGSRIAIGSAMAGGWNPSSGLIPKLFGSSAFQGKGSVG